MANFAPLKNRFLAVLDQNLDLFEIRGRFIDFGAGSGDVSRHLIEGGRVQTGVAYDPSFTPEMLAGLGGHGPLEFASTLSSVDAPFDLAVLFDVIEHVPDANETLQQIRQLVKDEGWLIVTVPYNAREWGADDEFYGHLRRLSRQGAISLLERNGWDVIRVLDPTFPTFWALRRLYLLMSRATDRVLGPERDPESTDIQRSLQSSRQSAWDARTTAPGAAATKLLPWNLLRGLDWYFESACLGFELFIVCQRRSGPATCETCEHGLYTNGPFFDRYSLQVCSYCKSEKLAPDQFVAPRPADREKVLPAWVESGLSLLRGRRFGWLRKLPVPDESVLDIRCGTGQILGEFHDHGWRAVGTTVSEEHVARATERGVEVVRGGIDALGPERFGLITVFNVIEHVESLRDALEQLDDRLLPGGYLVLEYPNARSWLKRLFGWRWFGYDPPYHRRLTNPVFLADRLGIANYRLVRESGFSPEYSYFVFLQTIANTLMPFQRDSLYKKLRGEGLGVVGWLSAILTVLLAVFLLPIFVIYQPFASLARSGCVTRQVFKKSNLGSDV